MISTGSRAVYGWPTTYYGLVLVVLMEDEEVCSIGQFTSQQRRLLDRAVKNGDLSTHPAAGHFPKAKRCYAAPAYDFSAARKRHIAELRRLAALDAEILSSGGPRPKPSGLRS
jgi:hypothetical protein